MEYNRLINTRCILVRENLYDLIFYGEFRPGFNEVQAKLSLQDLFKIPVYTVDAMFISKKTVLKKGIELALAREYVLKLYHHGLVVKIEPNRKVKDSNREIETNNK